MKSLTCIFCLLLLFSCTEDKVDDEPILKGIDKEQPHEPVAETETETQTVTPTNSPVYYSVEITAGEGGSVNTEGGSFLFDETLVIEVTPDSTYVFDSWSDGNQYPTRTITVQDSLTLQAYFVEKSPMNGWYHIQPYERYEAGLQDHEFRDFFVFYFENNIVKKSGSWTGVKRYWNIDTDEKAVILTGNRNLGRIANDYYGYEDLEERTILHSIKQIQSDFYEFKAKKPRGGKYNRYTAKEIDYENTNKMTDYYSEKGLLADSIYSKIDPQDPKSYIWAFFEDIKRYGGHTDLKPEDITVVIEDFSIGNLARAQFCNSSPKIWIDKESLKSFFIYDRYSEGLNVFYHELGHAVFSLDHLCETGHLMTGWHGAEGGLECRGEKTSSNYVGLRDLYLPHEEEIHNFTRAVKDLVTLNRQYAHSCANNKKSTIIME